MEYEAGDMLEVMTEYESGLMVGYRVVDPLSPSPDMTDSYYIGIDCPVCDSTETYAIKTCPCPNHPFMQFCFTPYCTDCWLVWEAAIISERRRQDA